MQKILLLEDNQSDANLVGAEIKNRWPKVQLITVSRLAEARKLMQDANSFDIALFDLKLPDGNGMDLLSELREQNCATPIIIFTSEGSEEIATTALKTGANDYIPKKPGYQKKIPNLIEYTFNQALANQQHLSVLYIEHHKSDIDLTLHYLKNYAPYIHLTIVSTGEEALNLLPDKGDTLSKFDVLLLDYNLPKNNAIEISKLIRQERKLSIAIVIVTGQGDENIAVEALKLGVDDYIVKHENYLLRLPSVITGAFRRKELERQKQALMISETKYRLLADYASDCEYWINPKGEYIYISPACEKTTGYPQEAFIKNKNLLIEISLPEYRKILIEHFTQKVKVLHEPIEFQILTGDGKQKWISHFCQPVYDENNKYAGRRGVNRDITEHKLAEIELRQSEKRFKRMFDDLGDAVYVTGIGEANMGKILEVNPAAVKQSGYSKSELLQMNIVDDLYVAGSGDMDIDIWDKKLRNGESILTTEKKRKKDGTEFWTEVIVTPIEFKGELAGLSINRDITERKLAGELLIQSELKYKQLFDDDLTGNFITSVDGTILLCNPAFAKILGANSVDELIKTNISTFYKNPKDRKKVLDLILEKKKVEDYELGFVRRDGKLISVIENKVGEFDENGNLLKLKGYLLDNTERKRSEQIKNVILNISNATQAADDLQETMQIIQKELGRLMDTSNFFVALYNEETDRIRLLYYQDEKDEINDFPAGKTLTGLVIQQGKSLLIDNAGAKKLEDEEKIEKVGYDSKIWLGVPLKIKGNVKGAVVLQSYTDPNAYTEKDKEVLEIISQQISFSIERKLEEEKLLAALEAAKESDRIKSAFLANMSHELRTPLNAVIGFSSLIDLETKPDDCADFAQLINKSGKNLLQIVDEIFEITLIERGQIDLKRSKMPILLFLNDIYQIILHRQINQGDTAVSIEQDIKGIDNYTEGYTDFIKLKQIFLSILGNAVKFTHEGFISFGVFPSEDGNNFVFFVKDSGIGIPKEMHNSIFEKFKIADESLTRKYGGVGAGLFISKQLIKLLGGKIWVESEEGIGSTFYFVIPR